MELTHLDAKDRPTMVDVGEKAPTQRSATASGVIKMSHEAYDAVVTHSAKKGPVLQTAIIAAVLGAKKTPELIPMCHPLLLTNISTDVEELPHLPGFRLFVTCKLSGKTGVEMEALTAVSAALLCIYDMCKAVDKGMIISDILLLEKSGGKSGTFIRKALKKFGDNT